MGKCKRHPCPPPSSLEPNSIVALSQQATVFAACVTLEGITRSSRQTGRTKSTSSLTSLIGASGIVGSNIYIYTGVSLMNGIGAGLIVCISLLYIYIRQLLDIEDGDMGDLLGSRARPTSMVLITFLM